MNCPLCHLLAEEDDLLSHPYWQDSALELAHSMNPAWNEEDGCCKFCFDRIVETVEQVWVPTKDFGIRGLKDGYRHVLTKRDSVMWNHINPDMQRWWQMKITDDVCHVAIEAGYDEWFVFDAEEKVLAQGRVTD